MPRAQKQDYTVWVYRPNGWLLTKITESATRSEVAVARAKKAIQKQGRLAHFYTYVPKTN
ncbi:hypothetical protein [Herminiimonas sp.]|uniref:hypothetical protein n=1 Tax=Herminiimonas sp. TaxID=1926289 RepID=UPI00272CE3BD|nr:hypothetical protein [Herminiimonas sp.]